MHSFKWGNWNKNLTTLIPETVLSNSVPLRITKFKSIALQRNGGRSLLRLKMSNMTAFALVSWSVMEMCKQRFKAVSRAAELKVRIRFRHPVISTLEDTKQWGLSDPFSNLDGNWKVDACIFPLSMLEMIRVPTFLTLVVEFSTAFLVYYGPSFVKPFANSNNQSSNGFRKEFVQ